MPKGMKPDAGKTRTIREDKAYKDAAVRTRKNIGIGETDSQKSVRGKLSKQLPAISATSRAAVSAEGYNGKAGSQTGRKGTWPK